MTVWKSRLDYSDYEHDYKMTFGAIVANIVNLVFPEHATRALI